VSGEAVTMLSHPKTGPQQWKLFDNRRNKWYKFAQRIFNKVLLKNYADVIKALKKDGALDDLNYTVTEALKKGLPAWEKAYKKVYLSVGLDFATFINAGFTKSIGGIESKGTESDWRAGIKDYLLLEGGQKITLVNETTRKAMMKSLGIVVADGGGADEMATRLATDSQISQMRALKISRTEVINASNLGSFTAAETVGIPLNKKWLATSGNRTRPTHVAANGQTVKMQAFFSVGGSKLKFPGDTSQGAKAKEVINCRCTQTYEPILDEGML